MTEPFGGVVVVVVVLAERPGAIENESILLGTELDAKKLFEFPSDKEDASSNWIPPTPRGFSMSACITGEPPWTLVISDSQGPVERLNSKSTFVLGGSKFAAVTFLELGDFSLASWRENCRSRSTEDPSSIPLAKVNSVQAVVEMPLLWLAAYPSIQNHLRLIPLEIGK